MVLEVQDPIVNAPNYYIDDLALSYVDDYTIFVGGGSARNSSNENDIIANGGSICSILKVGAGGCDRQVGQAEQFLFVFVIADSSKYQPTSTLLSADQFVPVLPFGYDMFRRVGAIKLDQASKIVPFSQYGRDRTRTMYYVEGIRVYNGASSLTFVDLPLQGTIGVTGNVTPSQRAICIVDVSFTPAAAGSVLAFKNPELPATSGSIKISHGSATGTFTSPISLPAGSKIPYIVPVIQYKSSSASDNLIIDLIGYVDDLI